MIRIGKLTDYAMLILSILARNSKIISTNDLAKQLHLSQTTVSKILKLLSDGALVTASRGAEGGYQLAKSPQDIKIIDVLECMEGKLSLMECCQPRLACEIDQYCSLQKNWQAINRKIYGVFANISLHEMQTPLVI